MVREVTKRLIALTAVTSGAEGDQARARLAAQPPQALSLLESVDIIGQDQMGEAVIEDGTGEIAVHREVEYNVMNAKDRTNTGSDPGHRVSKKKSLNPRRDLPARKIPIDQSLKALNLNQLLEKRQGERDTVATK